MSDSLKNAHAAILAEREQWAALSHGEKMERLRRQQIEAAKLSAVHEKRAAERDRVTDEKLEETLSAFRKLAAGVKPMTPKQSEKYNWTNRIAPQLRSLGLEEREVKQIADWGCAPQQRAFDLVRALCQRTGAVVALVGERGVGKTTIAAQLMRERVEASVARWWDETLPSPHDAGRYIKLGMLAAQFKPLYADFGSIDAERLSIMLANWCKLDLLVLDEIHECEDLKTQMRLLVDVVDRRYAARRDTILISNHDSKSFQSEMNHSILSRISEHGAIIPCCWESHRRTKK